MAYWVASVSPSTPVMAIYIQEIGRILALPHGAALTGPIRVGRAVPCAPLFSPLADGAHGVSRPTNLDVNTGWLGRNGTRCFATPIGPTPGPPPPCGMQKVL